jgi:endoglucanase
MRPGAGFGVAVAALFAGGSGASFPAPGQGARPDPSCHTLILSVSEDAFQGDARFDVLVDDRLMAKGLAATGRFSAGDWRKLELPYCGASWPRQVTVRYANDMSSPAGDRNLYVQEIRVDDRDYDPQPTRRIPLVDDGHGGLAAALFQNGSLTIDTSARQSRQIAMLGVNLTGAEETPEHMKAWGGTEMFPSHAEMDYFIKAGMNVIRLPLYWERLQHKPYGPLDPARLAKTDDVVRYANAHGVRVVIDIHNYATAFGAMVGSPALPSSAFADLWARLAGHFADQPNVLFGLMNEPHDISAAQWLASANAAIAAIRASESRPHLILVSGVDWDAALAWTVGDSEKTIGSGVIDPGHDFSFEVHEYFNAWSPGAFMHAPSVNVGVEQIRPITQWAQRSGAKLFLGEVGINSDTVSLEALRRMLAYMRAHSDIWLGATYWDAGAQSSFVFSIQPTNGVERPQMAVLRSFIPTADTPDPSTDQRRR